jgi:putative PIN family toxin of toxin-antitoxin system
MNKKRIFIDTNILISAIVSPNGKVAELLKSIAKKHTLIISDTVIRETKKVLNSKLPERESYLSQFFLTLKFEYVPDNIENTDETIIIRDKDDVKIIQSAYISEADILITNDKDFFDREYDGLEILKSLDFYKKYIE